MRCFLRQFVSCKKDRKQENGLPFEEGTEVPCAKRIRAEQRYQEDTDDRGENESADRRTKSGEDTLHDLEFLEALQHTCDDTDHDDAGGNQGKRCADRARNAEL